MKFSKLSRGEVLAMIGGVVLALSLFLPWYSTTSENPNSMINGMHAGTFSAWNTHAMMRYALLAAAAAPFILAWIVIREHELSWPRGEVTAVVAIAAMGLILYTGLIQKPGEPSLTIGLKGGWLLSVAAAALMLVGAFMRSSQSQRARKPPGVL